MTNCLIKTFTLSENLPMHVKVIAQTRKVGQTDGLKDGQKEGLMEEQTNGQSDTYIAPTTGIII